MTKNCCFRPKRSSWARGGSGTTSPLRKLGLMVLQANSRDPSSDVGMGRVRAWATACRGRDVEPGWPAGEGSAGGSFPRSNLRQATDFRDDRERLKLLTSGRPFVAEMMNVSIGAQWVYIECPSPELPRRKVLASLPFFMAVRDGIRPGGVCVHPYLVGAGVSGSGPAGMADTK